MKYQHLAEIYKEVSSTAKRLEKIDILAKFLKQVSIENKDVMYLLLGDIYPEYDERKIGISEQLTIKAISKATGVNNEKVLKEWREIGDLGKVAEKLIKTKKQSTLASSGSLTIQKVLENL